MSAGSFPPPSVKTIMCLNDDCLLETFGFLSVKDQLNLVKVCQRFRSMIIEQIWRRRFWEFKTKNKTTSELTIEEHEELFALNVGHMEKLTIGDPFDDFSGKWPKFSFYLSFALPKLTMLECRVWDMHDGDIRQVANNCPNLEVLRVLTSSNVTGEYIKDIRNLRELELSYLRENHLYEILLNLDLSHLNVRNNVEIGQTLNRICDTKLQKLTMFENVFVKCVGNIKNFTNLKSLCIIHPSYQSYMRSNQYWDKFCVEKGPHVKELTVCDAISSHNTRLNGKFWDLPNLRKLHYIDDYPCRLLENFLEHPTITELHLYSKEAGSLVEFLRQSGVMEHLILNNDENWPNLFVREIHALIAFIKKTKGPKKLHLYKIKPEDVSEDFEDPRILQQLFKALKDDEIYQRQDVVKFKIIKKESIDTLRDLGGCLEFTF